MKRNDHVKRSFENRLPAVKRALRPFAVGLIACVLFVETSQAQESDFPGIKSLMSVTDFEESGLDKLSDKELDALDAWLVRYTAGEAEVLQRSSKAVRAAEKDFEVESMILGDFKGWSGETVFRLDNGQIWQQRLDGKYKYRGPANPAVRISKNWLGFTV